MNFAQKQIKKFSQKEVILDKIKKYAYVETFLIVAVFLFIGYLLSPEDICLVHTQISFALIILTVITLFHGFENGLIAVGMLSIAMWLFYPEFPYQEFLIILVMTMTFSEFHYYWSKKIRELKTEAEYKSAKLNELSKAFYTLKISHDQLEKNYVIKPMSIRNALEEIIQTAKDFNKNDLDNRNNIFYEQFLILLEKSFSVNSALIIYKTKHHKDEAISTINSSVIYSSMCESYSKEEIISSYLVDYAIEFKEPIYVSGTNGEPSIHAKEDSKYLVAIPFTNGKYVESVLVITRMPFMSFNKENLISITILLEYLSITIEKNKTLENAYTIENLEDDEFRYEYNRLRYIYENFKIDSAVLAIKIDNKLQTKKVYEKIIEMLRSLDIATLIEHNEISFIVLLFPLNDNSSAYGFLNRLRHNLHYEQDKKFETMHFQIKELDLLNQYIRDKYNG